MKRYTLLYICLVIAIAMQAQKNEYPTFLNKEDVPNTKVFLPAPPDTASVAFFNDYARYQWGKTQRNTPRGQQAIHDREMDIDSMLIDFSDAIGMQITTANAPETAKLCFMVMNDNYNSNKIANKFYHRKRPFVQFKEHTSIPKDEASHIKSGSYPSTHASSGWAMTLILVELFPDHQDAILKRGYEFGQSRVIVGYHYQSDVDAARLVGSAVVARLHADQGFQKQLSLAKKEISKLKK